MKKFVPLLRRKIAKNEWENEDGDFLLALYNIMYKRLFFHTLVANLFKQRYITDQFSCKLQIFEQVNKWQIKTVLDF